MTIKYGKGGRGQLYYKLYHIFVCAVTLHKAEIKHCHFSKQHQHHHYRHQQKTTMIMTTTVIIIIIIIIVKN